MACFADIIAGFNAGQKANNEMFCVNDGFSVQIVLVRSYVQEENV